MSHPSIRRSLVGGFRLAAVVVASLATSAVGGARLAAAEIEPVAIIWNAPEGCPSTGAVHEDVEKSLGGSPKALAPVAAVVNVLQTPEGRWLASLSVHSHGEGTERRFEAESCPALASAAALIIALAAEGADEDPSARAAGDRRADRRAAPAIGAEDRAHPAQPAPGWDRAGPFLLVGALVDGGTMPSEPATGFEVAAGQSWNAPLWRLRLLGSGSYFLPENLSQTPLNFGFPAGRYWLLSLAARGCLTAVFSRLEVGPCLGAELAVMHGSGIGQTTAHSTQYWASPLGSAVVAVTVSPEVVVFARADVAVPSTRRSFLDDRNSEIYKVPAVAARGAMGVEVRFF